MEDKDHTFISNSNLNKMTEHNRNNKNVEIINDTNSLNITDKSLTIKDNPEYCKQLDNKKVGATKWKGYLFQFMSRMKSIFKTNLRKKHTNYDLMENELTN